MRKTDDIPSLRIGAAKAKAQGGRGPHPFAEPQRKVGKKTRRAKAALAERIKAWEAAQGKSPGGHVMHKPGSLK